MSYGGKVGQYIRCRLPRSVTSGRKSRVIPELLQGVALHLQVCRHISIGGPDACVAEIVTDHGDIDACLQKCDGATVPQYVRCQPSAAQRRRCASVLSE